MCVLFVDDNPGGCGFSRIAGCGSVPPQPRHETVRLLSQTKNNHACRGWKSDCCVVFSRVPAPVLMSKFSDTTKALMDVMSKQATSDTASALRWVSRFFSAPVLFFVCLLLICSKD